MIAFEFDYYKPNSLKETFTIRRELEDQGKRVVYYSGGTEIINVARSNQLCFDAVIDIKGIPECNAFGFSGDTLVMGAALPLNPISDSGYYPLLSATNRGIADRTIRNKLTLGGNICGFLPYREAVLPLLVADAKVRIATCTGVKTLPLMHCFNRRMPLDDGELLVDITVEKRFTELPWFHLKKTGGGHVGYPLVTIVAAKDGKNDIIAISGACDFPFREKKVEQAMNKKGVSLDDRVTNALACMPAPFIDDVLGSADYRRVLVQHALYEAAKQLGDG